MLAGICLVFMMFFIFRFWPDNIEKRPFPANSRIASLQSQHEIKIPPTNAEKPFISHSPPQTRNNDKPLTAQVGHTQEREERQQPEITTILNSDAKTEVYRIETDEFTLIVERPEADGLVKSGQASRTPGESLFTEIIHIVVSGDTLWDIAAAYLGDPFQYGKLAKFSEIKNPHLIYPGDRIRIIRKKPQDLPKK